MDSDLELSCDVCGGSLSYTNCTPPTAELLTRTWRQEHTHTLGEQKMYHDAEVAQAQYYRYHPEEDDE